MKSTVRILRAAVAVLAASLVGGCSGGDDTPIADPSAVATQATSPALDTGSAVPPVPAMQPVPSVQQPSASTLGPNDHTVLFGFPGTLTLDFEQRTWALAGSSSPASGSFEPLADEFAFLPSNSTGGTGTNTLRFSSAGGLVIGSIQPGSFASSFLAAREFATRVEQAQGVYHVFGSASRFYAHGYPPISEDFEEVVRIEGRRLRIGICADCPAHFDGEVTATGASFTARSATGESMVFRVALFGTERLLLPGAGSRGGVGVDVAAVSMPAEIRMYLGDQWGNLSLSAQEFRLTTVAADGAQTTVVGDGLPRVPGPLLSLATTYRLRLPADTNGEHMVRALATRNLGLFWYRRPGTNIFPFTGSFHPDAPAGFGIGRVRQAAGGG